MRPRLPNLGSRALVVALALGLPSTGWAWGSATHHYIAQNYSKHLPPTMDGLRVYDGVVDLHVTDPDTRRPTTPGEGPRHFIDIDVYPEFLAGTLTHDRAALEAEYGAAAVENNGIVPWAVGEVVTTLTQQFQAQQWSAAALTIADLCHYVGDSTQPLHCTHNYDGQYTGNSGVHSRYETSMMSTHIASLTTPAMPVTDYANVVDAMFDIVGASWNDVSPLLAADNTAKAASGQQINSTYYNSLWASTETFTRERINTATVATASFVYTAWINAGRPEVPGSSAHVGPQPTGGVSLEASPSPFRDALTIRYAGVGPLSVDVFDVRGARVQTLANRASGLGTISWRPASDVGSGLYFVRLTGPERTIVKRVTRIE